MTADNTEAFAVLFCYLGCGEGHFLRIVVQKTTEVYEKTLGGFRTEETHLGTLRPNGCLGSESNKEQQPVGVKNHNSRGRVKGKQEDREGGENVVAVVTYIRMRLKKVGNGTGRAEQNPVHAGGRPGSKRMKVLSS